MGFLDSLGFGILEGIEDATMQEQQRLTVKN